MSGEINTMMPQYVVDRVVEALGRQGKSIKEASVLVFGVAYKKDVDDTRESPALKLMDLLLKRGASVVYNDPHVPAMKKTRKYDFRRKPVDLTPEALAAADCVLICTDHTEYEPKTIVKHASLVVDTRGLIKGSLFDPEKVVRA